MLRQQELQDELLSATGRHAAVLTLAVAGAVAQVAAASSSNVAPVIPKEPTESRPAESAAAARDTLAAAVTGDVSMKD